jgi:sugar lactone lactonase YvrE
MKEREAQLFLRAECQLGEGPFWHAGKLWWVDIECGSLLSCDEEGGGLDRIDFGQRCASAVPAGNGTLLVALERDVVRLDPASRQWKVIATAEDLAPDSRFNDGKCDPRGRLVVGGMSPDGRRPDASLYSLSPDLELRRLRGGISISNGLAWSADGTTLYFIDTPTQCVLAYDYNLDQGRLEKERVILRFPPEDGWPDGMAIDRAGHLWISFWDGWTVRCYDPATSAGEAVVRVPCARPTSCCFGGAKLDRLFITTARTGLSADELKQQPLAGSIFCCSPEASGSPTWEFAH